MSLFIVEYSADINVSFFILNNIRAMTSLLDYIQFLKGKGKERKTFAF